MIPHDVYTRVEKPQKYVVYGDTDSLFINIPEEKVTNSEDAMNKGMKISEEINSIIDNVMNNFFLPRLGVDPQYNYTSFKTEIIIDMLMLLDIKKNYAYRVIAQDGIIKDPPVIDYKGLPIKKSDASELTKYFLKRLIYDIIFNDEVESSELITEIGKVAYQIREIIKEHVKEYRFHFFGIPKKWNITKSGDTLWSIKGMKLYNTIMNEPILMPMSGSLYFPITIQNPIELKSKIEPYCGQHQFFLSKDITISSLNYLFVPHNYNVEKTKKAMEYFTIIPDENAIDKSSREGVVHRVIEAVKESNKPY